MDIIRCSITPLSYLLSFIWKLLYLLFLGYNVSIYTILLYIHTDIKLNCQYFQSSLKHLFISSSNFLNIFKINYIQTIWFLSGPIVVVVAGIWKKHIVFAVHDCAFVLGSKHLKLCLRYLFMQISGLFFVR